MRAFMFESRFFAHESACQSIFDDFHLLFSKFFLYYFEDEIENMDTGRLFAKKNSGNILESVNQMAAVYQHHFENHMSEEDKAQKEVEVSYVMLHIHKNKHSHQEESPEHFQASVICIDVLVSETLRLMKVT